MHKFQTIFFDLIHFLQLKHFYQKNFKEACILLTAHVHLKPKITFKYNKRCFFEFFLSFCFIKQISRLLILIEINNIHYKFFKILPFALFSFYGCNQILNMHVSKTAELANQNSQFKTADMDYFTRGNQKIAFHKKTNFIGVVFKNEMSKESVLKLIDDWEMNIDAVYMNSRIFVLTFPINLSSEGIKTIRESIILFKDTELVGDILIQKGNSLVLATQDLIVKWKPATSEAVKQTFIKQNGLTEIREIPYIQSGVQYRIETYNAYASTDVCLKLLEADIVEYAESVIYSTTEND